MSKKLLTNHDASPNGIKAPKRALVYCTLIAIILLILYFSLQKESTDKIPSPLTDTRFALNTVVTITLYDTDDKNILDNAFNLCTKYENIFSRTLNSSELYKVNHSDETTLTISDDLAEVLKKGLEYSKLSNGAFDITIAPISSLWDFTVDNPQVPAENLIKQNIQYVDYRNVSVEGNTLKRANSYVQFDLGAIAKGYIADQIKQYLKDSGVNSGTISLGGNILCIGKKPDSSPFNIGVQSPFEGRNDTLFALKIDDKSVVTSGIYERYFKEGEKLYHHILNPSTGYPYDNELIAVTILSDSSTDGDALSTFCFSLGLEKGLKYVNEHDNLDAVFITSDNEIHYSNGFEDKYELIKTN